MFFFIKPRTFLYFNWIERAEKREKQRPPSCGQRWNSMSTGEGMEEAQVKFIKKKAREVSNTSHGLSCTWGKRQRQRQRRVVKKTVSPHNKQHSDEKVDEGLQLVLITWANVSQLTMEGGEEKSLDQQTELDHQMDFQDHVVAPPRREERSSTSR